METEYTSLLEALAVFLAHCSGEDYDAAYYYIGQHDFDQSDPDSVRIAAELVLVRATAGKVNPYRASVSLHLLVGARLYPTPLDREAPQNVLDQIARRTSAEAAALERGVTYVPDSEDFSRFVGQAINMPTYEAYERMTRDALRHAKASQTFRGQFASNLKDQLQHPVETMGVGGIIFALFVILYVLFSIASMT